MITLSRSNVFALLIVLVAASQVSKAADLEESKLDRPYGAPHPIRTLSHGPTHSFTSSIPTTNDLAKAFQLQTPVKSQKNRGTCSIFSTLGSLESLLKANDKGEYDLAENYLEFIVMAHIFEKPTEGSDTPSNVQAIQKYGAIEESLWPYEAEDWTEKDLEGEELTRAKKTCGGLRGNPKKICLLSHLDPGRDSFESNATALKSKLNLGSLSATILTDETQVKEALLANQTLILGVDFFYAAWNHSGMERVGLGTRNKTEWSKGRVGTPTDKDIQASKKDPAGHSIVIVGYNDTQKVYYFKNSWGTESFGKKFEIPGVGPAPGYGSITYDYAHQYGTFYVLSIR